VNIGQTGPTIPGDYNEKVPTLRTDRRDAAGRTWFPKDPNRSLWPAIWVRGAHDSGHRL